MNYYSLITIVLLVLCFALLFLFQRRGLSFNTRSILSLCMGLIFGLLVKLLVPNSTDILFLSNLLKFIGGIYIKLLIMLIIPLVITSIIHSIVKLREGNGIYMTRIAIKSIVILLITTGVSAIIGAFIAYFFHISNGLILPSTGIDNLHHNQNIYSTILAMIPGNPIEAMANNNIISVVIFSIFFGIACIKLHQTQPEKVINFISVIDSAFEISKKLANMIIQLTPYGVIALIANMTISQGINTIYHMLTFIGAMYFAMFVVIIMHILLLCMVKYNPIFFFRNVYPALIVAFTTRSSLGTMPVTMGVLRNKLHLSGSVSNFVPGMGATVGMNACAGIYPAMLVIMTTSILGNPITWKLIILVGFINMISSLGVSGIPGTAFVAAGVTLSTLGLPYSIVALVQGIDPIIDMGRTATNINAVMTTAVVVDKTTSI